MARLNRKHPPINPKEGFVSPSGLNDLIASTPRQIVGGKGIGVDYLGDRLWLRALAIQRGVPDIDNYLCQFVVIEEFDDVLLCSRFIQPSDESTGLFVPQPYEADLGDDSRPVYVAKPYHLQRTPWDGKTVALDGVNYTFTYDDAGNRNVGWPGGSRVDRIDTPYFPGDIVLAVRGATGVSGEDGSSSSSVSQYPVDWQDTNRRGREWRSGDDSPTCLRVTLRDICLVITDGLVTQAKKLVETYRGCQLISSEWLSIDTCCGPCNLDCPTTNSLCVTLTGVNDVVHGRDYSYMNRTFELIRFVPESAICTWFDDAVTPLARLHWPGIGCPATLEFSPTFSDTDARYESLNFNCVTGGTFVKVYESPSFASGYPEVLEVTAEPCPEPGSGTSSGTGISGTYPPHCEGTGAFCLNVDGSNVELVENSSGLGVLYEQPASPPVWSLGFSSTSPPAVVFNSGTGTAAVFHLSGNFTCAGGGTFVKVYDSIGISTTSVTVVPGTCP